MELLTKEIVLARILADPEADWWETHDYWNGDAKKYSNAPNGYDVNVIGKDYIAPNNDVVDNDYLCVVTHCDPQENGDLAMTDDVIFCFWIEET